MKKRTRRFLGFLGVACVGLALCGALVGCGKKDESTTTGTTTDSAATTTDTTKDATLRIGNPDISGASWSYTIENESIAKYVKDEKADDGQTKYTFGGVKEGDTLVVFEYKAGDLTYATETFLLRVDKDLKVTKRQEATTESIGNIVHVELFNSDEATGAWECTLDGDGIVAANALGRLTRAEDAALTDTKPGERKMDAFNFATLAAGEVTASFTYVSTGEIKDKQTTALSYKMTTDSNGLVYCVPVM